MKLLISKILDIRSGDRIIITVDRSHSEKNKKVGEISWNWEGEEVMNIIVYVKNIARGIFDYVQCVLAK